MALSRTLVQSVALPRLRALVSSLDPFVAARSRACDATTLLFPIVYHLNDAGLQDLECAASEVGDVGFFYAHIENVGAEGEDVDTGWYIAFSDPTPYLEIDSPFESALWSPSGQWAILISHEWHALAIGTPAFVAALEERFGDRNEQMLLFLMDIFQGGARPAWVPDFVARIVGESEARHLIDLAVHSEPPSG